MNIRINPEACIRCSKCVKVCPSKIFSQSQTPGIPEVSNIESCIACGHCVAACPAGAVEHSLFPSTKIHPIDYNQLPTAEQMMLLCKTRRSNRAFSTKPIPAEYLETILEAAHRAPTGSNSQNVSYTLVTDPEKLRAITAFTMNTFGKMLSKMKNPFIKPIIKMIMPDAMRYIPVLERIENDYAKGGDQILRRATAVILIHTPLKARMGHMDANLAYQNGSLMAETLGVSQFYTGFVLNAVSQSKGELEKILGIEGRIQAGMALGMPQFRYPNYIDKKDIDVTRL